MGAGKNIKDARERLGLSPARFGKLVGVSRTTVENWESERHYVRDTHVSRLSQVTGLPRSAFNRYQGGLVEPEEKRQLVPVLEWIDLRYVVAGKIKMSALRKFKHVEIETIHSADSFLLRVADASMSPVFNIGDRIIVDPAGRPLVGDYVVARLGGEHIMRRYEHPRGEAYDLVAENADFPTRTVNLRAPAEIVGVVVEHHKSLKR